MPNHPLPLHRAHSSGLFSAFVELYPDPPHFLHATGSECVALFSRLLMCGTFLPIDVYFEKLVTKRLFPFPLRSTFLILVSIEQRLFDSFRYAQPF